MKISILGLSANPVTNGHIGVSELIVASGAVDEVWFLPCYHHMYGKDLIDSSHRLKMCELAGVKVCDWEVKNGKSGKTYETVVGLKKEFPEHEFSWIIGSDNADTIHKWYNYEELVNTIPFLVVQRAGSPLKGGWYDYPPHKVIPTKWVNEISSTLVRAMVKSGDPKVVDLVPASVLDYIRKHNFYKG
jgi:nicotinate-nucleotide adenylyltransferase